MRPKLHREAETPNLRDTRTPSGETFGAVLDRIERERAHRQEVKAAVIVGMALGVVVGCVVTVGVVLSGAWLP